MPLQGLVKAVAVAVPMAFVDTVAACCAVGEPPRLPCLPPAEKQRAMAAPALLRYPATSLGHPLRTALWLHCTSSLPRRRPPGLPLFGRSRRAGGVQAGAQGTWRIVAFYGCMPSGQASLRSPHTLEDALKVPHTAPPPPPPPPLTPHTPAAAVAAAIHAARNQPGPVTGQVGTGGEAGDRGGAGG